MKNKKIPELAKVFALHKKIIDSAAEFCSDEDFVRQAYLDLANEKRDLLKRWRRHCKKLLADLDAPK